MVEEKLEVNQRRVIKRGQKLSRRLSGKSPNLPPTLVFPRQTQQLLMTRTTPSQVLNLQFPQLQGTPFVIFLQLVFRELVFCYCSFDTLLKKILSGVSQVDQEDPRSLRLSNRWRESSLGGGNHKEGKVCLFPEGGCLLHS